LEKKFPWNALAIAVAGACIGLGLYLGRPPTVGPTPAPAVAATDTAKAHRELVAWLESQRPAFIQKCWEPSVALAAEPARASYTFNLVVDRDGKEVGRGISEFRDAFRADVGTCLRGLTERVTISPPGDSVTATLTVTLPN